MTEPNYKELSKELYEMLTEIRNFMRIFEVPPGLDCKMDRINNLIRKYKEETAKGTGRTTSLYMKAIAKALENPGESVEFIDHHPHNWDSAKHHEHNLRVIIQKLGYDIIVQTKGQAQVYLYNNRFVR